MVGARSAQPSHQGQDRGWPPTRASGGNQFGPVEWQRGSGACLLVLFREGQRQGWLGRACGDGWTCRCPAVAVLCDLEAALWGAASLPSPASATKRRRLTCPLAEGCHPPRSIFACWSSLATRQDLPATSAHHLVRDLIVAPSPVSVPAQREYCCPTVTAGTLHENNSLLQRMINEAQRPATDEKGEAWRRPRKRDRRIDCSVPAALHVRSLE
jgi:hypothetical protein